MTLTNGKLRVSVTSNCASWFNEKTGEALGVDTHGGMNLYIQFLKKECGYFTHPCPALDPIPLQGWVDEAKILNDTMKESPG